MRTYDNYKDSGIEWIGEIPKNWDVRKLKHFTQVIAGSTPSSTEEKYWDGDIYWVTTDDLGKLTTKEITNTRRKITNEGFESCGTKMAPSGSVVISSRAPIGHIGKLTIEACTNQGCKTIIFTSLSNSDFYYYFLKIAKTDIQTFGKGTTFTELPTQSLRDYLAVFPGFEEQTAIANYLDRKTTEIDQVVADKEAPVNLYEEEKKALINEAVTKGLNVNIKLKPSGIDWLSDIPEHWKAVPLTKYLDSIVDYRGRTPNKIEEGVFLVTAKNVKNGIIDYKLSEEYVSEEEQKEFMKRGEVKIGDVLFTTEAPLGEVANIDRTDICLAQRIIKFRANEYFLNNYFLKFWLRSYSFQQDLQTYATGSTALGIKASKLNNLVLVLPPLEEQTAIVQYIESETANINDKINRIKQEIDLLKEYRQALIFEAVTGKVKVS